VTVDGCGGEEEEEGHVGLLDAGLFTKVHVGVYVGMTLSRLAGYVVFVLDTIHVECRHLSTDQVMVFPFIIYCFHRLSLSRSVSLSSLQAERGWRVSSCIDGTCFCFFTHTHTHTHTYTHAYIRTYIHTRPSFDESLSHMLMSSSNRSCSNPRMLRCSMAA
jgi:hypothetical protein